MTAGFSATTANALLDTLTSFYVQLHTGDPGAAGTANQSAVTTRQQATLAAAGSGSRALSNIPAFLMTATETIRYVSVWSASSSGTFQFSIALTTERAVVSGDFVVFNQLTVPLTPIAA